MCVVCVPFQLCSDVRGANSNQPRAPMTNNNRELTHYITQ